MKTYVLDVLENVLTEEEANQYYYKAFIEMNKREKIPYIVNENRYLKFLLRLYKMDKNVVYKCRFFEKWCFIFLFLIGHLFTEYTLLLSIILIPYCLLILIEYALFVRKKINI